MTITIDGFCCQGGACAGYLRAGHIVTGVDNDRRNAAYYPAHFRLGNVFEYVKRYGHMADFFHMSPPCQGYTRGNAGKITDWPKLIPEVRDMLEATGKPYIIENVKDAEYDMHNPVRLCGCMFDLHTTDTDGITIYLQRIRSFESNFGLTAPRECDHSQHEWVAGAYGGARRDKYEAKYERRGGYVPRDKNVVKRLLGIEHNMTWKGLFECIPPAYTEYIGKLVNQL